MDTSVQGILDTLMPNKLLHIATVVPKVQAAAFDHLKGAGFKSVGTYKGRDGRVHLMVKGLTKHNARSKQEAQ
jgi:hypothetical protein